MTESSTETSVRPTTSTQSMAPPEAERRIRRRPTRISSLHVGLTVAAFVLVLLAVFLIQNAHTVQINFFGAHLRMSLAVAMLVAALAGAVVTGAAGTARITQLQRTMRKHAHPKAR
ncbi:MAG: hypothetical protein QOG34_113 [Frankiaceae bacterium]|jgi:uncharacterized integral membrane protein|nr:hypothetical protein [Frankiaceae bacterium]